MKRLVLGLLCLLLTACSFTFQGTEYSAVRYQYGVWVWVERADGTYEQWMLNAARKPYYSHYVNGRPAD
jgi:hypothetical protein